MSFPEKKHQDDFIFVFEKNGNSLVFGLKDAEVYKEELLRRGYVHKQTLCASVVFENLLNINQKEKIEFLNDVVR